MVLLKTGPGMADFGSFFDHTHPPRRKKAPTVIRGRHGRRASGLRRRATAGSGQFRAKASTSDPETAKEQPMRAYASSVVSPVASSFRASVRLR